MGSFVRALWKRRGGDLRRAAAAAFSLGVFLLAIWVLHRALGRYQISDITAAALRYPQEIPVKALLLSMCSYVVLGGFDWLGLRYVRRKVPLAWTMLISFLSHAISHNAGFAILTGGSVRLRMYSAFGLGLAEVGGIVAFAGISFALGILSLAGLAFIIEGDTLDTVLRLPPAFATGLGYVMAAVVVGYGGWAAIARKPLEIGRWRVSTPSPRLAMAQIIVAALDLILVAAAVYTLLPREGLNIGFPAFVGVYVVATIAGTLSHVPGGVGVFEGALLLMLPSLPVDSLLAAVLVFRVLYNIFPLVLAALFLAVFELVQRFRHQEAPPWILGLGPAVGAVLVFAAGALSLVSGAVAQPSQMPPWLAEPAYLLSCALAVILLGGAWWLLRQSALGLRVALAVLAVSSMLALLRGPDWISFMAHAGGAAILAAAAPLFRQRGKFLEPIPLGWMAAMSTIVAGAFWLAWRQAHAASLLSHDALARGVRGGVAALVMLAVMAVFLRFQGRGRL